MTSTTSTIWYPPGARSTSSQEAVGRFVQVVRNGADWAEALLETMSIWTAPEEEYFHRRYQYMIAGEAFDWLLLAERICLEAGGVIPSTERDQLLFHGQLPSHITSTHFRRMLGAPKYRAHLNYWYGVVVEQALQIAVEDAARKEHRCKGMVDQDDVDDLVCLRIYGSSLHELMREFRREMKQRPRKSMSLTNVREFTYWLFKRRLRVCDRARVASDTRKGLLLLQHMSKTPLAHPPIL